jgi:RNA polymerase sigma-70 factor (ECF subfamily)
MQAVKIQGVANTLDRLPIAAGNPDVRDESWLVARAKLGHEDALGELYQRHQFKSYRMALRILRNQQDAEDAMQRAFQRVVVNLERFRGDSTFSTWVTRISINEALMCLRERRIHEPLHVDDADGSQDNGGAEIGDGGPNPEQILCDRERHTKLRQAIAELPQSLRAIVVHKELQELSNAETAQRLGLTESAVKSRTLRARKYLRKYIERNEAYASLLDSGESAPI